MKIRTDFVTNSSSSSFTLEIGFWLANGKVIRFEAQGGTAETGRVDYFDSEALVTVSPKQLGTSKNVEELIRLLTDGVLDETCNDDGDYEPKKIFKKSEPHTSKWKSGTYDAYDFIKQIREEIKSIDDIESVFITGNEDNYVNYNRSYYYNRITGEYSYSIEGTEFEKDGSSGGDLRFSDEYEAVSEEEISERKEKALIQSIPHTFGDNGLKQIPGIVELKYTNQVISDIVKQYGYSNDLFDYNNVDVCVQLENWDFGDDATIIQPFAYYGIDTLGNISRSIISLLVSTGTAKEGFAEQLISRVSEISQSFEKFHGDCSSSPLRQVSDLKNGSLKYDEWEEV